MSDPRWTLTLEKGLTLINLWYRLRSLPYQIGIAGWKLGIKWWLWDLFARPRLKG